MEMNIYGILDRKIGFINIFCEQNDNAAVRGFSYSVKRKDSIMNSYSRDYALFKIGTLNVETGLIEPINPNMLLINGDEVDKNET